MIKFLLMSFKLFVYCIRDPATKSQTKFLQSLNAFASNYVKSYLGFYLINCLK